MVIVQAVVLGLIVSLVGVLPWAMLVKYNLKHFIGAPWAVIPEALYLWLFWRYVQGAGPPRSTSEERRTLCRAHRLSSETWAAAILAGMVGLGALVAFLNVFNRLVRTPPQQTQIPPHTPALTVALWVVMGSVVAGVVEEAAFRGYMQGPIERRHGPAIAILVTGIFFGFAHFTHPEVSLRLMPFYMFVAAIFGALAYLTNSILPGVVVHASADILGAINLFGQGQSEWHASPKPGPLVWETGADASFWLSCLVFAAVAGVAVWAFAALARVARKEREQRDDATSA
jgi:membrane protease YdiL (CAAX protease family)